MAILIDHLHFDYTDSPDKNVIDIPSWQVNDGEHVFIHGPSGCGKSTLLNLLSGMLQATGGTLKILDQDLTQLSNRQRDQFRAQNIGYVFQRFNLIPYLSPVENIQLAAGFAKNKVKVKEVHQLLKALHLDENTWEKAVENLSMGQQQRVAIARALINKPKLIIADEPTSSLDSQNRDDFMDLLMSQSKQLGSTLIMVSHDLSLEKYFSRIESFNEINREAALS